MRCSFCALEKNTAITELLQLRSKREYKHGYGFDILNLFSTIQIRAYIEQLEKNNIRIESLFEWFFSTYIQEEFGVENFYASFPSNGTTYYEKCKLLFSEFETILKQYNMYVEDGEIDNELLEISFGDYSIGTVKSLQKIKNLYLSKDKNTTYICYYLFSDQSMLGYINEKLHEDTLCELLIRHKICIDEFPDYNKVQINELINNGIIYCDSEDKTVKFVNPTRIFILRDIYFNETLPYGHLSKIVFDELNKMLSEGKITSDNYLLSKPEVDYFDYHFNKARFNNGPDLRNKYSHGTHTSIKDEQEHINNYYIGLKLMAVLIVKINDDLCLCDEEKKIKLNK